MPRLLEVDALRGAWFLRTDHLHFLFREPLALPPTTAAAANGGATAGSADLADEAEVSARLRRHADLPSLVVPVAAHDRSTWGDLRGGPLPPTAAQLRAWRRVLWRGARRGDAPPPWRAAAAAAAAAEPPAVARAAAANPRLVPPARAAGAAAGRPPLLLLLRDARDAAALRPLYLALRDPASLYEPRMVDLGGGGGAEGGGGCAAVMAAVGGSADECARASAVYELRGGGGGPAAASEAVCAGLSIELDELLRATRPAAIVMPRAAAAAAADDAASEAAREAAAAHGVLALVIPAEEAGLLEWVALVPPAALGRWHVPRVHVSVITHRRPASLSRLLRSLSSAHYLGDAVSLSFSIDAGADAQTLSLARTYPWAHGPRSATLRVRRGGLIAAVVESWFPEDERSYGLLLEDDIEVSPYFYVYLKLVLLGYVYATDAPPTNLAGHLAVHAAPRRAADAAAADRRLQDDPRAAGRGAARGVALFAAAAVLVGLALLPEALARVP